MAINESDIINWDELKTKLGDQWNRVQKDILQATGIEIDEEALKDNVNHPSHYTFGNIEVIDYIRDKLSPVEFQGYCEGNVLKYVSRWRHKGGIEDLEKAKVYLEWMIASVKNNKEEN